MVGALERSAVERLAPAPKYPLAAWSLFRELEVVHLGVGYSSLDKLAPWLHRCR